MNFHNHKQLTLTATHLKDPKLPKLQLPQNPYRASKVQQSLPRELLELAASPISEVKLLQID